MDSSVTLLVSLSRDDVLERLGPHDLRIGSSHHRISVLPAHPHHFLQDLVQAMLHLYLAELPREVRHHPAGHLMLEVKEVVLHRPSDGQPLSFGDLPEVSRDRRESILIQVRLVAQAADVLEHALGGRQGGAVGQRRDRGMDGGDAGLDGLQIAERSQARIAVAMELERYPVAIPLDDGDQSPGALRGDDARSVLDHDAIDAVLRVRDQPRLLHPVVVGVERAAGVHQRSDHLGPFGLGYLREVAEPSPCSPGSRRSRSFVSRWRPTA